MIRLWLLSLLLVQSVWAVEDVLEFPNQALQQRYQQLTEELRCPKCQNQNLADSNSMISVDLRNEVYRLLMEGHSNQQIKDHLVARYGDFVLYNPPVKSTTWLLWLLPLVLLTLVVLIPALLVRRQRNRQQVAPAGPDQDRLDALLNQAGESTEDNRA